MVRDKDKKEEEKYETVEMSQGTFILNTSSFIQNTRLRTQWPSPSCMTGKHIISLIRASNVLASLAGFLRAINLVETLGHTTTYVSHQKHFTVTSVACFMEEYCSV